MAFLPEKAGPGVFVTRAFRGAQRTGHLTICYNANGLSSFHWLQRYMGGRVGVTADMADRDRDDRGRYREEYAEEDFLDAVRENEPATTSEVAATVGCVRQNADYRLRQLEAAGRVESKKVGPALVWMVPDS